MATLSIAVATTGAVLGVGALAQCVSATKNRQVEVSEDAVAKGMGVVPCRLQGRLTSARRHVTLIGDLLVVSSRPGSAERMISLKDAEVVLVDAREAKVVKVLASSGATLATFWPGSEDEAARWAADMSKANLPSQALPKYLSLNRQHREAIQAETADWEEQIKKVQSNPTEEQAECLELEGKMAIQEGTCTQLQQELAFFAEMPKKLSLNRRQIAELEGLVQQKESQLLQLQNEVQGMEDVKKILSMDRKQVAALEGESLEKESTVAELQGQLQRLQEIPKLLSFNRKEIATLEATIYEKDGMISGMQERLDRLAAEVPKMLSTKRREVSKKEQALSAKEMKIQELESQLQGFKAVPKILSFNRKQVAALDQRTSAKERQLRELRKQITGLASDRVLGA